MKYDNKSDGSMIRFKYRKNSNTLKLYLVIIIQLIWMRTSVALESTANDTVSESMPAIAADSTDSLSIVKPPQTLITDPPIYKPPRYNPFISTGLSALLPGAGQIYCGRRGRGAAFLAADLILALITANRINYYKNVMIRGVDRYDNLRQMHLDSMNAHISNIELYTFYYNSYIDANMGYDLALFQRRTSRYVSYQCLGWSAGVYLWNIADALGSSNRFTDNDPRSVTAAAGLSAVPFLGLGQLYNGAFAKAGLIWTMHSMLAYMSFNYNSLMNDCINKRNQVKTAKSIPDEIKMKYVAQWNDEYNSAFRKRNTYLWYLVLFYFYGIFDAAVDAHLHDARIKIRLEPAAEKTGRAAGLLMNIDF